MSMVTALGFGKAVRDDAADRERALEQLRDQERRVYALDRAVEVIQRSLLEDHARDDA